MNRVPDWARAHGAPPFAGRIRTVPDEFQVTEQMNVEFSGDGEHDWLWVEKIGANTAWVAEQLAKHAGVAPRDVGYAGRKDRHAVTRQWFSVRRPSGSGTDWSSLSVDGVTLLDSHRHHRKLRHGAHRGNRFRIAVRADTTGCDRDAIENRFAAMQQLGVPNYFGAQRFGHDGGNIELGQAVLDGKRLPRNKRNIGISALRAFRFNEALDARVQEGTWDKLLPGDVANLDGTGSIFDIDDVTPDLDDRCARMDIHPAGLLPGFEEIRLEHSYRALRMRASGLSWSFDGDIVWLEFGLRKGCYATVLLHELVCSSTDSRHSSK